MNILICDDNERDCRYLEQLLKKVIKNRKKVSQSDIKEAFNTLKNTYKVTQDLLNSFYSDKAKLLTLKRGGI